MVFRVGLECYFGLGLEWYLGLGFGMAFRGMVGMVYWVRV